MNTKSELVKILIVDDLQDNLQVMLNSLFSGGYLNILCARNGLDAIQIVHNELPGIIILDWDMPVMNGIEVLKKLREDPRTKLIPVIIATGAMLGSKDLENALASGATDYIRKPYDNVELLARVKSALDFSTMLQTIQTQKQQIEQQNITLRENEKRLMTILNASNEAIIFIEKYTVTEASQLFCDLTGLSYKEVIGQSFFNFFPNELRKNLTEIENMNGNCMSVSLIDKNGENLPVIMMIKQAGYKDKPVLAASFFNRDQFKQLKEFPHNEIMLNDLNTDLQTLKNENLALHNHIQFITMQSARCNDVMAEISKSINDLILSLPSEKGQLRVELTNCNNRLKQHLNNKLWDEFKLRFAEIHTTFYDKLINRFPSLTENDLRLCAFIKLKMSTKEIATIINQPVNSVKVARNRLRTKLQIEDVSESLLNFLATY